MKIAVIGDTHLGFAWDTPRQEDSFRNARDAVRKSLEEKPDIIIQLGDMFHDRVPKFEVLAPGINIWSRANAKLKPVKIFERVRKGKLEQMNKEIPAIITISGNHERRSSQYVNPVQLVEKSNAIYTMHAESIVVEANGERIGIHGLSSVPNNVCAEVIRAWNPKPFPGMPNIMLFHQNFREVIPILGDEVPSFADMPPGFDVYLCGDIHWRVEDKHPSSGAPIIFTGSTVKTQLKKLESTQKKGIYIVSFEDKQTKIMLKILDTPREFTYETMKIDGLKPSEILIRIEEDIIKKLQYHIKEIKPIVRYKLKGKLADGFLPSDLNAAKLIKKYENKLLVFVDKVKVVSSKFSERAKFLADLKSKKVSVEELGLEILCKRLGVKDGRKIDGLLQTLGDNNLEGARAVLEGED